MTMSASRRVGPRPDCRKCGRPAATFAGKTWANKNPQLNRHELTCKGIPYDPSPQEYDPPCPKCGKTADSFTGVTTIAKRNWMLERHKSHCKGKPRVEDPCPKCGRDINHEGYSHLRLLCEKNKLLASHKAHCHVGETSINPKTGKPYKRLDSHRKAMSEKRLALGLGRKCSGEKPRGYIIDHEDGVMLGVTGQEEGMREYAYSAPSMVKHRKPDPKNFQGFAWESPIMESPEAAEQWEAEMLERARYMNYLTDGELIERGNLWEWMDIADEIAAKYIKVTL